MPIHSQLYNEANLAWGAKLAIFLAHAVLFIVIASMILDAVANTIRPIRVNSFTVGIFGVVITIWLLPIFYNQQCREKAKFRKI